MSEWLPVAISAARIGGAVLMRHFRRLTPAQVREKSENDWVSLADNESESAIVDYLARVTPGVGVLAEERGGTSGKGPRWVVDPLDGTANYVRGFPHFAVSVALVDGDAILAGVVYDPVRDECFTAARGRGAACNGRPIAVSGRAGLSGGMVTTGFPFRIRNHLDAYLELFRDVFVRTGAIRRPGSAALDLAHTAAGIFDAFFEFALSPWDIAAGALLVEEAGGAVSNLEGGVDFFSRGNIVAGSPAVHREIVSLALSVGRDEDIV